MSGWVGGRLRFCNNYQALYIKLDSAGSRSVCRCYRPLQGGLCGGGGYGDLWLGQAENADNVIPFVNYGNGNFCPVVELLSLVSPVQSSLLPPFIPHLKSPSNVISFAFIIIICGIPERFTSPHSPHFKVSLSVSRKWRRWWWAGGVWEEDDDCIYMHSIPQSDWDISPPRGGCFVPIPITNHYIIIIIIILLFGAPLTRQSRAPAYEFQEIKYIHLYYMHFQFHRSPSRMRGSITDNSHRNYARDDGIIILYSIYGESFLAEGGAAPTIQPTAKSNRVFNSTSLRLTFSVPHWNLWMHGINTSHNNTRIKAMSRSLNCPVELNGGEYNNNNNNNIDIQTGESERNQRWLLFDPGSAHWDAIEMGLR